MKSEKKKPKTDIYDPYKIDPPEECWICGQQITDWRQSKWYMGHRCCKICFRGKCE